MFCSSCYGYQKFAFKDIFEEVHLTYLNITIIKCFPYAPGCLFCQHHMMSNAINISQCITVIKSQYIQLRVFQLRLQISAGFIANNMIRHRMIQAVQKQNILCKPKPNLLVDTGQDNLCIKLQSMKGESA